MSSRAENKICGICSGSLASQAIFTADCSHSFHFICISSGFSNSNLSPVCPLCRPQRNHFPFSSSSSSVYDSPSQSRTSSLRFYSARAPSTPVARTHLPPVLYPDALELSDDDEPWPANPISSFSLQRVSIKAIPERPAIAASRSETLFSVLVGVKAPSLSADSLHSKGAPIDLVMVLDVSGSMYGAKLNLVKRAVQFVIDNLGPSDRLSIVSFAYQARRILPLCRMTTSGCDDAKSAINYLSAHGGTNIIAGLKEGAQVLGERRHRNPVASIIFLSDGNDTCNPVSVSRTSSSSERVSDYLGLLPPAIRGGGQVETIPVHSFGFGSDHDPITMHAISDASGGTFSFIESYEMVQDAFASCIGGLLSVVTQELRLTLRSASHGVEIKSIPSGGYTSEITNRGSRALINVGELYADEEKEFLINLLVPVFKNEDKVEERQRKTPLLDVSCSYKEAVSKETVQIEGEVVEIRRPKSVSPQDMTVNLEVDRQRNLVLAAESIAEAQKMAEMGNLREARSLLANRRRDIVESASAQAGDGVCLWVEADMKETETRMGNAQQYRQAGRAYALSGRSSLSTQRKTSNATTNSRCGGGASYAPPYETSYMANMVRKSRRASETDDDDETMEAKQSY